MQELRIVLVSYACDPSRGTEPGMGWAWAEALAGRGHTVELLTHPNRDSVRHIAQRIEELGPVGKRVRPHLVPGPADPGWTRLLPGGLRGQAEEFLRYDGWQRRALDHARRHGLGRAHLVHHVSYGSLEGGSALRHLGPPLVFGPVGGGQTAPYSHRRHMGAAYRQEALRELLWVRGLSHRSACRATLREAAEVLTTNRDTARLAHRLGRPDARMMLADGVPDGLVREHPRDVSESAHPPTVLWVGRLVPRKAPGLALQTFALLQAEIPDARLVVVGDGPLRAELETLALRLDVAASVSFQGQLPWGQVLKTYDEADLLLFTSLRDSFGVQSLEAWARGLPVVHLDHQGVGDFSAPGGAVAVPLGDPEDLPQRLAHALGCLLPDVRARSRMSTSALEWARQHTWTVKSELVEQLYYSVVAGRA
ncbi:glycosyltransferase family 4 protein [Actinacidiphila soli]|uniref:glycosyltransferase family 4 protein n=1 Tax=Actinacidiphila soli TaxID=2487275 RepID=UPI000FCA4086|nr:glycosyltransferase [Actinacidiphila soli]